MDGKVLTKQNKKNLAGMCDDLIKAGVFEIVDGLGFELVIGFIDKQADKVIPDNYDLEINEIVELAINADYEMAFDRAGIIMNDVIDIPYVGEEVEAEVFKTGMSFLASLIRKWIIDKEKILLAGDDDLETEEPEFPPQG